MAWSPDGKLLVLVDETGIPAVWDTYSWQKKQSLDSQTPGVIGAAWSPDGKWLLTWNVDGVNTIWDTRSWQQKLLTLHRNGSGLLRDTNDLPEKVTVQTGDDDLKASSIAWSPDGKRLATGKKDGNLALWDAVSGKGFAAS